MECSYGIIPITWRDGAFQVFLVQHRAGHWGFPKGHPSEGETPLETAKRELYEETGLIVAQLLSQEVLEESYEFERDQSVIKKTVRYYLATVVNPLEISIDKNEILEGKWIVIQNAPSLLTFAEARRLCQMAALILSKGDGYEDSYKQEG